MNKFILLILFFTGFQYLNAQYTITGNIIDDEKQAVVGATVKILSKDSSLISFQITDSLGAFNFKIDSLKNNFIQISYLGFKKLVKQLSNTTLTQNLGTLLLTSDSKVLKEVEVTALQKRGEQKEDTTQFNADAYKVNKDATAEDLIKKMPGVTSDNTGVKVNGETVQKVLVDGKPFFGDDANASLKNIPAEIIDKVEFFDKMSDQAAFTGFTDDNNKKTINLVTKRGKNVGQFGKIYAGAGIDEGENVRYNSGFTLNSFKSKQRISVLGLFNNINQQNFSISDINGALSNTGIGGGSGRGGQGNSNAGGMRGVMNAQSNLMTSNQAGISETQAIGINYSDEWSKKTSVSGSYFFNLSANENASQTLRNYFSADQLLYNQTSKDNINNQNHRFNFRIESKLDSSNTIIVNPAFIYQKNNSQNNLVATNTLYDTLLTSSSNNQTGNNASGYDANNSFLWMHKFKKNFRTFSINLFTQLTEKSSNGDYISENLFSTPVATVFTKQILNQNYNAYSNSKRINPTITYTEPIFKNSQLQLSYSPGYAVNLNNKIANDFDSLRTDYVLQNIPLSNSFNNTYITQKGGISYRFQNKALNFSIGSDVQSANLVGNQIFPSEARVNNTFNNILPNVRLNYKIKKNNLRLNYRTNTNIPSVTQLQNVLDISNALQPKIGNPSLKQTYEHSIFGRYGGFNSVKQTNIMVFTSFNYINNNISSISTTIANDTIINGVTVKRGALLNTYTNLNNYIQSRTFFNYSFPFKKLKSNVNLNTGFTFNQTPSKANNLLNYARTFGYTGGIFVGSNVNENIDFSLSYNASYTDLKNTVQVQADNQFLNQTAGLKVNFVYKRLILNSDFNANLFSGLTQKFNQNFNLWNAFIGYKLLKNKNLEAKISVYDLLNQNASIGRTFNANYSEDFNNLALRRYYLFTITYNIRNFKKGTPPKPNNDEAQQLMNQFPGGMPIPSKQ